MTRTAAADAAAITSPSSARPPARPANASAGSVVQRPTPGTAPMAPAAAAARTIPASQTAHQSSEAIRGFFERGAASGMAGP